MYRRNSGRKENILNVLRQDKMLSGHLQINQSINRPINQSIISHESCHAFPVYPQKLPSWTWLCLEHIPPLEEALHPPYIKIQRWNLPLFDPYVSGKSLFLLPGIKSFILWSNCSPKSRALLVKLLANKLMDIFLVPMSKALRPVVSMDDISNLYDFYLPFNWAFLSLNHLLY